MTMNSMLTGAFLDVVGVNDGKESIIGATTDDIHIHPNTGDVYFQAVHVDDCRNLRHAGVVDESGQFRTGHLDALRLVLYHEPDDDHPAQIIEVSDVETTAQMVDLPIDDVAIVQLKASGDAITAIQPDIPLRSRLARKINEVIPFR